MSMGLYDENGISLQEQRLIPIRWNSKEKLHLIMWMQLQDKMNLHSRVPLLHFMESGVMEAKAKRMQMLMRKA